MNSPMTTTRLDDAEESEDDPGDCDTSVGRLATLGLTPSHEAENHCDDAEHDAADDAQERDDRGHQRRDAQAVLGSGRRRCVPAVLRCLRWRGIAPRVGPIRRWRGRARRTGGGALGGGGGGGWDGVSGLSGSLMVVEVTRRQGASRWDRQSRRAGDGWRRRRCARPGRNRRASVARSEIGCRQRRRDVRSVHRAAQ